MTASTARLMFSLQVFLMVLLIAVFATNPSAMTATAVAVGVACLTNTYFKVRRML